MLYYQDNGEMYEVNANDSCGPECSPVVKEQFCSVLFLTVFLPWSWRPLISFKAKYFRKYTGRGFFFPFCCSITCGCRGTSFGCPKHGVSSKLETLLLEELYAHNLDIAEASLATAPFLLPNLGLITILTEERKIWDIRHVVIQRLEQKKQRLNKEINTKLGRKCTHRVQF